ncbi:MAG: LacI family transcriptional regulator [Saprospiraceae bacterium]|nr:LacI family transcriptional regulator [Saprospiraceae bacterium]
MTKRKRSTGVTIYDLAAELNVSPSTVSRALNDHKGIGKKTKKAVKELAKKREYLPNNFAYSLRTKKSKTIGILVSWINRPFISTLISGIERAAREAGYHVIITQTHDKLHVEIENLRTLLESGISALIVSLSMETKKYDHFSIVPDNDIPIVYVDRIPKMKDINKVHINNFEAAFEATEHLIEQGCKRISHFGGSRHQLIYAERRKGFIAAIEKHNCIVDESIILESDNLSAEEGFRLAETVLNSDNPPDGIFCANDAAAVSAIRYAKAEGIKIPQELAIMGFNNDPICEIVEPQLSSVSHPALEMGEVAVEQALGILNRSHRAGLSVDLTLGTSIIVRGSTKRNDK